MLIASMTVGNPIHNGVSSFHVLGHSLHSFFLSDELLMCNRARSFVEDAVS